MRSASEGRWSPTWLGSEIRCSYNCQTNLYVTVFRSIQKEKVILDIKDKAFAIFYHWYDHHSDLLRSKSHASLPSFHESDSCYESSYSGIVSSVMIFSCNLRLNLESLEDLKRRVDCLELSNRTYSTLPSHNDKILPEPEDELLSAKLWLFNRSKQINKEKS